MMDKEKKKEYDRKRYLEKREYFRAKTKKWAEANEEFLREYGKNWRKNNEERCKGYREKAKLKKF